MSVSSTAARLAAAGIGAISAAAMVSAHSASSASASAQTTGTASPSLPPNYKRIELERIGSFEHHLLHAALSGQDKLERYELYLDREGRRLTALARLGPKACGHPHIVHGGAIASLLDDAFGSLFFACRLGNGFTANLSVDYRAPIAAGVDLRIETQVDRIEGRKVFLVGRVVDNVTSALYSEGRALFITKAVPTSDALFESVSNAIDNAHAGESNRRSDTTIVSSSSAPSSLA